LVLNRVSSAGFDWTIPGYRRELVTTLIRMLPKKARRELGPAAEVAEQVLGTSGPDDGPLLPTVAGGLARLCGMSVEPEEWDVSLLPEHLRVTFEVVDEARRAIARGRDLEALRHELAQEIRTAIKRAAPDIERHGATAWEWGDLPRVVERGLLRAYPALVDEGETVGVEVLDTAEAQADAMWRGTRRLLLLGTPLPFPHLQRRLSNATKLALVHSGRSLQELFTDCATASADEIIVAHGGPTFESERFAALLAEAGRALPDRVATLATIAGGVLAAAEDVQDRVTTLAARDRQGAIGPALTDVRRQVQSLVAPGFVTAAGAARLGDLLRYLKAATRRLEKLPGDARRDSNRQAVVDRIEGRYEALLEQYAAGAAPRAAADLAALRWMIEELRVSLWAQDLGTAGPISEERIMRALARASGSTRT
jgi:ATP-dependent helicase HrpA